MESVGLPFSGDVGHPLKLAGAPVIPFLFNVGFVKDGVQSLFFI